MAEITIPDELIGEIVLSDLVLSYKCLKRVGSLEDDDDPDALDLAALERVIRYYTTEEQFNELDLDGE